MLVCLNKKCLGEIAFRLSMQASSPCVVHPVSLRLLERVRLLGLVILSHWLERKKSFFYEVLQPPKVTEKKQGRGRKAV